MLINEIFINVLVCQVYVGVYRIELTSFAELLHINPEVFTWFVNLSPPDITGFNCIWSCSLL